MVSNCLLLLIITSANTWSFIHSFFLSCYRLVWGDGYFKGREEDQLENAQLQREGVQEKDQLLRRQILGELQALVGSTDQDDASASPGVDYVSDSEWFYLVSMSYSFPQGVGYVIQITHSLPLDLTLDQLIYRSMDDA